ncbi:hypothetical protein AC1031_017494 [Aphanomyces cochlioides]|nr:hypothetical protein AC1031_017494 [Aphanomyces cochlioides]
MWRSIRPIVSRPLRIQSRLLSKAAKEDKETPKVSIAPKKKHEPKGKQDVKPAQATANPAPVAGGTTSNSSSKMDPYVRDIALYIGTATTFLLGAAAYKNYLTDDSLEMDVFVQAKYLATRNKTVIDITGLPTEIEKSVEKVADDATEVPGKMILGGAKGKATIEYVAHRDIKDETGKHVFITLDLITEDNERQSLLRNNPRVPKTPEEEAAIKAQRQEELKVLGSSLVLPGLGFFAAGCVAAYMVLRILRNRPSYVIQLALDRINATPRVADALGAPVKTNKNVYVGSITDTFAAFESKITGPKGEGTMKVQAMRPKEENAVWQFSHLSLDVQGRSKRINLLEKEMK